MYFWRSKVAPHSPEDESPPTFTNIQFLLSSIVSCHKDVHLDYLNESQLLAAVEDAILYRQ